MKYLLVVIACISLACAYETHDVRPQSKLNQEILSKIDWEELTLLVEEEVKDLRAGSITADVTNFTAALLENVGKFISSSGLDPMALPDNQINLFPGSLKLTNGSIQNLSSILTADDVWIKYSHDTRILEITLPIGFDQIVIKYNYKITVVLVSVSGSVAAKVKDFKLNLRLGFNFSEYHAFVDKIDVKDSGSITIDFHGLGPLNYLVELLTNTVTTLFHGIILSVINAIIYDPISSVVDQVNTLIDSILHPNSTSYLTNIY